MNIKRLFTIILLCSLLITFKTQIVVAQFTQSCANDSIEIAEDQALLLATSEGDSIRSEIYNHIGQNIELQPSLYDLYATSLDTEDPFEIYQDSYPDISFSINFQYGETIQQFQIFLTIENDVDAPVEMLNFLQSTYMCAYYIYTDNPDLVDQRFDAYLETNEDFYSSYEIAAYNSEVDSDVQNNENVPLISITSYPVTEIEHESYDVFVVMRTITSDEPEIESDVLFRSGDNQALGPVWIFAISGAVEGFMDTNDGVVYEYGEIHADHESYPDRAFSPEDLIWSYLRVQAVEVENVFDVTQHLICLENCVIIELDED